MTWQNALEIGSVILASLGGGGLIVFSLSNFLGNVWADRLMQAERSKHNRELEQLRASLEARNQTALTQLTTDLEIYRERHLKTHQDKIATYRMAVDVIATILANFDRASRLPPEEALSAFDTFNRDRIRLYGYLALMVPQEVMDSQDALIDHLLLIAKGQEQYEWKTVRELALRFANEIRRDVGIDNRAIEYRGRL